VARGDRGCWGSAFAPPRDQADSPKADRPGASPARAACSEAGPAKAGLSRSVLGRAYRAEAGLSYRSSSRRSLRP